MAPNSIASPRAAEIQCPIGAGNSPVELLYIPP
jgi:hypothetical protein